MFDLYVLACLAGVVAAVLGGPWDVLKLAEDAGLVDHIPCRAYLCGGDQVIKKYG
jgi:hypothetical protein